MMKINISIKNLLSVSALISVFVGCGVIRSNQAVPASNTPVYGKDFTKVYNQLVTDFDNGENITDPQVISGATVGNVYFNVNRQETNPEIAIYIEKKINDINQNPDLPEEYYQPSHLCYYDFKDLETKTLINLSFTKLLAQFDSVDNPLTHSLYFDSELSLHSSGTIGYFKEIKPDYDITPHRTGFEILYKRIYDKENDRYYFIEKVTSTGDTSYDFYGGREFKTGEIHWVAKYDHAVVE